MRCEGRAAASSFAQALSGRDAKRGGLEVQPAIVLQAGDYPDMARRPGAKGPNLQIKKGRRGEVQITGGRSIQHPD